MDNIKSTRDIYMLIRLVSEQLARRIGRDILKLRNVLVKAERMRGDLALEVAGDGVDEPEIRRNVEKRQTLMKFQKNAKKMVEVLEATEKELKAFELDLISYEKEDEITRGY